MIVLVNVIKPQGLEPLQFPTKFRSHSVAIAASDNEGSSLDPSTGNAIAWSVMLGGAALGAVKIHPREEELLFQSGAAVPPALTLSLSPVLSKTAKGAALSLSW